MIEQPVIVIYISVHEHYSTKKIDNDETIAHKVFVLQQSSYH